MDGCWSCDSGHSPVLYIQRLNQPNLELKIPENIDDHALKIKIILTKI